MDLDIIFLWTVVLTNAILLAAETLLFFRGGKHVGLGWMALMLVNIIIASLCLYFGI